MGVVFLGFVIVLTTFLALYWVFYGQRKHNEMLNPKRKTELKAILFDFDGVLLDSYERQFVIFNELRKKFSLKAISKEEYKKRLWGNSLETNSKTYFSKQQFKEVHDMSNKVVKNHTGKS